MEARPRREPDGWGRGGQDGLGLWTLRPSALHSGPSESHVWIPAHFTCFFCFVLCFNVIILTGLWDPPSCQCALDSILTSLWAPPALGPGRNCCLHPSKSSTLGFLTSLALRHQTCRPRRGRLWGPHQGTANKKRAPHIECEGQIPGCRCQDSHRSSSAGGLWKPRICPSAKAGLCTSWPYIGDSLYCSEKRVD